MARPRNSALAKQEVRQAARQRAVLYARVSSAEQEREGFSIPAQQKLLREYAAANGISIVAEQVDVETAKRTGRTGFAAMLSYIKSHPTVRTILVEKTDRLYRNLKDWVTLDGIDVEIHFVKEGVVLTRDSRSSEKFMHGIKVLMAKNYIDNLSEEARKGMHEKAEQGIWPSCAPLGYANIVGPSGKKVITIDPEIGPLITRLFEWFETGQCSIKEAAKKARDWGLRYRKSGQPLAGSTVHRILRNRIYTGSFDWKGKTFSGTHTPLVSYETWANVQEILDGRSISNVHGNRHQFAFTGLVTCGHCGCAITAEIKKGKYIYYHCSRFKARCPEPYIREEALAEKFAAQLRRMNIDEQIFGLIRRALKETAATEQSDRDEQIKRLRSEADRLQVRLDALYVDKVEGNITAEFHDRMAHGWRVERQRCIHDLEILANAEDNLIDDGVALLEVARSVHEGFVDQPLAIKQRALNLVLSNATLANGELTVQFREPFDSLSEIPGPRGGGGTPHLLSNPSEKELVGERGFEPPAPASRRQCSTRLS